MGQYEVIARCAYLVDGAAVVHRKLGVIVEVDDETAAGLPGALVKMGSSEPAQDGPLVVADVDPEPLGQPAVFVESPLADHVPGPDAEKPVEPADEAPKSKRRPTGSGRSEPKAEGDADDQD